MPAEAAGTVDVTVTTSGGTSATSSADQYTYTAAPTIAKVTPAAGPLAGGGTVTITGANLAGATAVHFGPTPATFTPVSASLVTATVPVGSGTVDVTVTTPGGVSPAGTADHYAYLPRPTVTKISPIDGPLGGGTTVTITGTGFSQVSAVKFGTKAAKYVVASATRLTATALAGSGTADITVTTPGGTSKAVTADRFSYLPRPAVTRISPSRGTSKGGTTVTITGTGFTAVSTVWFGSKAAHFKVASSTKITATAPAGSGTVNLKVATPGGISNIVAADRYTYVAPAKAVPAVRAQATPAAGARPAAQRGVQNLVTVGIGTYAYNGDGLRASKSTPDGTFTFTYDTTTSVPELLDDGVNSYIYGPGGLVIEQVPSSGDPQYLFHDALGSTRVLTDSTGAISEALSYGPYGELTSQSGTDSTPIGYAGGYTDSESGLIYLVNRYYDPATGQFVSIDPDVTTTGQPYSYATDDPVNGSDPSGLFTLCVVFFCGGYDKGQGVNYGLQTPGVSLTLGNKTYGLPSRDLGGSIVCWTGGTCMASGGYAGNGVAVTDHDGNLSTQLCGGFFVYSDCVDPTSGANSNEHQISPSDGSNVLQQIINKQPKNAFQSAYSEPTCTQLILYSA